MNGIQLKVGICGRFKIEAVRPDGTKRLLAPWQDNLLTDSGMDSIGSGALSILECHVGSGSAVPTFADTALQTEVGVTSAIVGGSTTATSSSPYYTAEVRTFRFPTGVAAGNLSEFGMGATSGPLISRALIKDSFGNPTTITVLSSEQLDVTYEFRRYQTEADWTGSVTIGGVPYAVIVRPAFINTVGTGVVNGVGQTWVFNPGGLQMLGDVTGLGIITDGPNPASGSSGSIPAISSAPYVSGTYHRDTTYFADIADGNMPYGANWMLASLGVAKWQVGFVPNIPKDGTKTLLLVFRFSWARHTP